MAKGRPIEKPDDPKATFFREATRRRREKLKELYPEKLEHLRLGMCVNYAYKLSPEDRKKYFDNMRRRSPDRAKLLEDLLRIRIEKEETQQLEEEIKKLLIEEEILSLTNIEY